LLRLSVYGVNESFMSDILYYFTALRVIIIEVL